MGKTNIALVSIYFQIPKVTARWIAVYFDAPEVGNEPTCLRQRTETGKCLHLPITFQLIPTPVKVATAMHDRAGKKRKR